MSRAQFKLFCDVLHFDSTYKTNAYRFSLVMVCGVDNHFKMVAILYNEIVESYCWLIQQVKQEVGGALLCVLTDQYATMRTVIKSKYLKAKHRIYCWHLEHNALQSVGKHRLVADFGDLITTNYNVEDFEIAWQNLDKKFWGKAYCRGYFMAVMMSTQRAESMNSYLKLDMNPELNLCDFLKYFHTWKNESIIPREPDSSRKTYIQEAINEDDTIFTFRFVPYHNHLVNTCCSIINWPEGTFECQSLVLESKGIPCRHIISTLKNLQQTKLPNTSSNQMDGEHWCEIKKGVSFPLSFEDPQCYKYAQLHKECAKLYSLSSQTEEKLLMQLTC
ncbi:hypothetical protein CDL12_02948 [Handroanthus impetiginosus]|uniref:MULE transposase domain-containing protein n=1 Tax=Handroanthus impetiginosus TaxID=429701 RepID=A0A2G9I3J8_9LAMI|nr:hypothetical protein CDL12_02948 [Handroanthus impetiginosus]